MLWFFLRKNASGTLLKSAYFCSATNTSATLALSGIRLEVEKKTVEKILDCLEVDWELIRRFHEVSAVRR